MRLLVGGAVVSAFAAMVGSGRGLAVFSIPTNSKPIQDRKRCRDCERDEFGSSHTTDQHKSKQNSKDGENEASGQVEALLPRHFLAQGRQRGASNSICEKTRHGGQGGVPSEAAHQASAHSRMAKAIMDV